MEPEGSLRRLHQPATCPYPEPDISTQCPNIPLLIKIRLNIILPSTPVSFQVVSFPQISQTKTIYSPLLSLIHATCPTYLIFLYLITRNILGEEYRSVSSSVCSFLHSLVTSSLLGPNFLLSTLFTNTLSLRSSLSGSDQVSHPYKEESINGKNCSRTLGRVDVKNRTESGSCLWYLAMSE